MIKVTGIDKVKKSIIKYGDEAVKAFEQDVNTTAQLVATRAKELAPIDNGTLRQSIKAEKQTEPLTWRVTSYMPYSAYHEFGTGIYVNIKKGWHEMAAQFKGKGIRQVNILPEPFMYPASVYGQTQINKLFKDTIKHLNKKFNG